MNIKYISNDIAIDTDTIEELANNRMEAAARRILYKALNVDHSNAIYYVATNGRYEFLPEDPLAHDLDAIRIFRIPYTDYQITLDDDPNSWGENWTDVQGKRFSDKLLDSLEKNYSGLGILKGCPGSTEGPEKEVCEETNRYVKDCEMFIVDTYYDEAEGGHYWPD